MSVSFMFIFFCLIILKRGEIEKENMVQELLTDLKYLLDR